MKITKEGLKAYNLYDKLPEKLKKLQDGQYFVFFYDVDEENLKLFIYEEDVVKELNVKLYQGMADKIRKYKSTTLSLGFFSNTFDTKDGVFYQFLRTFNDSEAVNTFYSNIIEQDRMVDISVSTDCINSIYNSEDFRRAISYFCPNRLQTIMFVYDMVNNAFEQKLSKRLYGDMVKKVVNMVKYDAGIMPEIHGHFRYMVIGENASLTEEQKIALEEAKLLARSNMDLEDIYTRTGWALSTLDGKWRTNISDSASLISDGSLFDYNDRKLYIPNGDNSENVIKLIANPNNIYKTKYTGVLSDVLHHPTLYNYYPELAILPILYFFGSEVPSNYQFYYAPDKLGGYILIKGTKADGNPLSILLHEVQHKIQNLEGFATGGNQLFAQFVASVGSASVRKIFACLNKIQRFFKENLLDDVSRLELKEILIQEIPKNNYASSLKKFLNKYLEDQLEYDIKYQEFCFFLIQYIAEQGDFTRNEFVRYLAKKLGDFVYELVENISEGYISQKSWVDKLQVEGYSEQDINIIRFKNYENLYGEIESRGVQSSRLIEGVYNNYFYFGKWDFRMPKGAISQVTVIDGKEEILDTANILGAVEKKGDEYVLHFNKMGTSVPFLHELGHIVHDALVTLGQGDIINREFENQYEYLDESEFFVSRFLGYLKNNIDDADMLKDMRLDFSIKSNDKIDEVLDEFFADRQADERLTFLQNILSLI
jgi:hypothetical protein